VTHGHLYNKIRFSHTSVKTFPPTDEC